MRNNPFGNGSLEEQQIKSASKETKNLSNEILPISAKLIPDAEVLRVEVARRSFHFNVHGGVVEKRMGTLADKP